MGDDQKTITIQGVEYASVTALLNDVDRFPEDIRPDIDIAAMTWANQRKSDADDDLTTVYAITTANMSKISPEAYQAFIKEFTDVKPRLRSLKRQGISKPKSSSGCYNVGAVRGGRILSNS